MIDVVSLGELLIDLTPIGISENGNSMLEVNPGGAPCNVLAMLSNLGCKTAFIGKVGNDHFGKFLYDTIKNKNIDVSNTILDENYPTTLAFVHLNKNGDRSFSFYRDNGADCYLDKDEVDINLIKNAKLFHFGTLSMTNEPVKSATKYVVDIAKNNDLLISFDPNLRLPLWKDKLSAKQAIEFGLINCDILKLSQEELEFIVNTKDIEKGTDILLDKYDIKIIFVTMGSKGSMFRMGSQIAFKKTYDIVNVKDTTGAGDIFYGTMLYRILKVGFNYLTNEYLKESLEFANAAASLIVTRTGVINVIPTYDEIIKFQHDN